MAEGLRRRPSVARVFGQLASESVTDDCGFVDPIVDEWDLGGELLDSLLGGHVA